MTRAAPGQATAPVPIVPAPVALAASVPIAPALVAVVLGLALAGCSGSGSSSAPSAGTSPDAASPGASSPDASSTEAPVGQGTLLLRGDGLALRTSQGTSLIPFGSGTSVVAPALAASVGEPRPRDVECDQGSRQSLGVDDFDVLFDSDRFVGWAESSGALATEEGLALGDTKAQVQAALPDASFMTSTLGPEFTSSSGLGGVLDGDAATSLVLGLAAGESCAAR